MPEGSGRNTAKASESFFELLIARIAIFLFVMGVAVFGGIFSSAVNTQSIIIQVTIICWILAGPLCRWITGRVDVLDPLALMCLFGIHYFIFGPIFQLSISYWPFLPWTPSVESYVPVWYWWQTGMLALGLVFTKISDALPERSERPHTATALRLRSLPLYLMIITLAVKIATIVMLGGFSGIVASYQARIDGGGVSENNTFAGLGVIVSIGNAFPIAFGYWVLSWARHKRWVGSRRFLISFSIAVFLITLVSNGLMGSRASIVYCVVVVIALYHFSIKPFKPVLIVGAIVLLFSFSQIYYAFKFGGLEGIVSGGASSSILKEREIDSLENFGLIRDYTRMDVQTLAVYSVEAGQVPKSWGRSYLGGLAAIVPSAIWPSRMDSFTNEKSSIVYGRENSGKITNLVFGGFGELYVNFGIFSIFACPIIGAMLSFMRRLTRRARQGKNLRAAFVAPLFAILPVMLLVYDSNSLLYVIISIGVVPFMYFLLSRRISLAGR